MLVQYFLMGLNNGENIMGSEQRILEGKNVTVLACENASLYVHKLTRFYQIQSQLPTMR